MYSKILFQYPNHYIKSNRWLYLISPSVIKIHTIIIETFGSPLYFANQHRCNYYTQYKYIHLYTHIYIPRGKSIYTINIYRWEIVMATEVGARALCRPIKINERDSNRASNNVIFIYLYNFFLLPFITTFYFNLITTLRSLYS